MINSQFAIEFAEDWIESWNSHDIERIVAHYEQQLVFYSPLVLERYDGSNGVLSTQEQLREYFLIGLTKNPALKFKLIDVLLGVNQITLYYENARGGRTAELFEFNKKGKVVRSSSCYSK